jgi:hypothetical protein
MVRKKHRDGLGETSRCLTEDIAMNFFWKTITFFANPCFQPESILKGRPFSYTRLHTSRYKPAES